MIIGLSGYAGSGKDAAASALVASGWKRIAFADPVREGLFALDPIIAPLPPFFRVHPRKGAQWEFRRRLLRPWTWFARRRQAALWLSHLVREHDWEATKKIPEVRRLLQKYGTEAGRDIHGQDCWLAIAERKVREAGDGARIVFTDVRFANEADMIRRLGGRIVRIVRIGVGAVNSHVSEKFPFEPDELITNHGTLEELATKMHDLSLRLASKSNPETPA